MRSADVPTRRAVTIYDVARAAEVSHASVSRYMRGLDMRAGTRAKIQKALETLDYKPNLSARALITGRSHRIGALTDETHQVGPSLIIQGATAAAREAGFLLDVITLDMGDVTEISGALASLLQYDLAGILAFASTDGTRQVFEETAFDVPVVIASEADEGDTMPRSHLATRGIRDVVAHLADLGHTRLVHIAGPADWSAARNRAQAFTTSVVERGLENLGVVHGDWSARSAHELVMNLPRDRLGTAIVAANDQMALGAMHALHARGLQVPRDLSVTGVDDTPESAYFVPSLTTIKLDFRAQGRQALDQLLSQIGQATSGDIAPVAPLASMPVLVLRDSTGPAAVS